MTNFQLSPFLLEKNSIQKNEFPIPILLIFQVHKLRFFCLTNKVSFQITPNTLKLVEMKQALIKSLNNYKKSIVIVYPDTELIIGNGAFNRILQDLTGCGWWKFINRFMFNVINDVNYSSVSEKSPHHFTAEHVFDGRWSLKTRNCLYKTASFIVIYL